MRAKELYFIWFKQHPDQANPSDLNTEEKYNYALSVGYEEFKLMEIARKQGLPFTKKEYWDKKLKPKRRRFFTPVESLEVLPGDPPNLDEFINASMQLLYAVRRYESDLFTYAERLETAYNGAGGEK